MPKTEDGKEGGELPKQRLERKVGTRTFEPGPGKLPDELDDPKYTPAKFWRGPGSYLPGEVKTASSR